MNERIAMPLAMVRVLRVLVIDAHTPERRRLVTALAEQPEVDIVGETENPERAIALAASVLPDVVLLAANLSSAPHGEVVEKIRAAAPGAQILMLTRSAEAAALADALRAGACGYLVGDDCEGGSIADSLRSTVARGGQFGYRAPAGDCPTASASPLSPREGQILTLVAEGWTNKQIARELGVAESTVKVHVQHILRKLKLESRVQAAVYAAENGLSLKH